MHLFKQASKTICSPILIRIFFIATPYRSDLFSTFFVRANEAPFLICSSDAVNQSISQLSFSVQFCILLLCLLNEDEISFWKAKLTSIIAAIQIKNRYEFFCCFFLIFKRIFHFYLYHLWDWWKNSKLQLVSSASPYFFQEFVGKLLRFLHFHGGGDHWSVSHWKFNVLLYERYSKLNKAILAVNKKGIKLLF